MVSSEDLIILAERMGIYLYGTEWDRRVGDAEIEQGLVHA